jgi:prevent-host-death family protein
MAAQISQRELRNDSGAVLRRVERGERLVVTRRGIPVADLVPHDPEATHDEYFVDSQRFLDAMAGLPPWGVEAFRKELEAFEEFVDDEDRDPWER